MVATTETAEMAVTANMATIAAITEVPERLAPGFLSFPSFSGALYSCDRTGPRKSEPRMTDIVLNIATPTALACGCARRDER